MSIIQDISNIPLTFSSEKKVAVIGFGAQGSAQALNLKDSGFSVIIGLPKKSKSVQKAQSLGFEVMETGKACSSAEIILLLAPDELHGEIFSSSISDNLKAGSSVVVGHGFSFNFGYVKEYALYNIALLAPKGISTAIRANYVNKKGNFALISVFNQVNNDIDYILLQLARGIGVNKIMTTTFKEECETDLFGEQAVLCGGVIELFSTAFETLIENGYSAEISYFECVQELKFIVDLIFEKGLNEMFQTISNTAKFGGLEAGKILIDNKIKEKMQKLLDDIQNGKFAKSFMREALEKNYAFKKQILEKYKTSAIEEASLKVIDILK